MLDLRRAAAPAAGARFALAMLMTILCCMAAASASRADTGQLSAFGSTSVSPNLTDQFLAAGPVALDGNDLFVASLDNNFAPIVREFKRDGTLEGAIGFPGTDPSGHPLLITGIAVDGQHDRLYVLTVSDVDGEATGVARTVHVYSTTPTCTDNTDPTTCTFGKPAGEPDDVLFDFTAGGNAGQNVDFASGVAVDPGTHEVAVLGVDDATASNPTGVIQYINEDGTASTRVANLGTGLDPDGAAVRNPAGLAIAATGDVYVATGAFPDSATPLYTRDWTSESVYRLARHGNTSSLVVTTTKKPVVFPGAYNFGGPDNRLGTGSPIAVSADGSQVYLLTNPGAGTSHEARVRGFSTAPGTLGAPVVVYGGGAATCNLAQPAAWGLAGGTGNDVAVVGLDFSGADPNAGSIVHVFGDGGTGCPKPTGSFTVNNAGSGTITVTKGSTVAFDASGSQLAGGVVTKVLWDFDGSGAYATAVTGSPATLTNTSRFLHVGTVTVGMRFETDSTSPSAPVTRAITVVAPAPTASFKPSTASPAAGGTVTFDANASLDSVGPDGNPTHALAKYQWNFGDGQTQETTSPTVSHAFANGGTSALARVVKLTVVSQDGVPSAPAQQTVTVAGVPASGGPAQTPPAQTIPKQTPPPAEVTPPAAKVSGSSVDGKGVYGMKVACPAGAVACTGKVTLTTKVKKKVKGRTKTTTVQLGTVSFSVDPGKSKDVKLKLSSAGRSLLKKQKKLSVSAAVSVTAGGKTRSTSQALTLKAPARRR